MPVFHRGHLRSSVKTDQTTPAGAVVVTVAERSHFIRLHCTPISEFSLNLDEQKSRAAHLAVPSSYRKFMRTTSAKTLPLFSEAALGRLSESSTTFRDNVALPMHNWFRYSAGFSALGDVGSWSDLHPTIRKHLICSCSQHAALERIPLDEVLAEPSVNAIRDGLTAVCNELTVVKQQHGGKKSYDVMIARYFSDMSRVLMSLRRATKQGASVVLVIGDSAPYGVHVPVDTWLGDLAVRAGFTSYRFVKVRDRNTKWKNRKHTVPLHEGELWIGG